VDLVDDLHRDEPPAFVEPLTERERAVLDYLPTMMSNGEIAQQLLVSVNTVKTHLKAVYRKLGVERRRDAVVRARQLELL
jgi:LuxR family maltose regulon positive regulatory protein